jgi:hypothetical protein
MSDSSEKSEKESVQEDESDLGDDDLCAETLEVVYSLQTMSSKEHIHFHLTFLFTCRLKHAFNMKQPTKTKQSTTTMRGSYLPYLSARRKMTKLFHEPPLSHKVVLQEQYLQLLRRMWILLQMYQLFVEQHEVLG